LYGRIGLETPLSEKGEETIVQLEELKMRGRGRSHEGGTGLD